MRNARWLGYALLAVVTLGVVLVAIVGWRFYVPSAGARKLDAVYADRPQVADADNGWIYIWGFTAPEGADVVDLAQRRVTWLREKQADPYLATPDPLGDEANWTAKQKSAAMERLTRDCRSGVATPCAVAYEAWPFDQPFSAVEILLATRYETLIAHHRWSETVPHDTSAPLPSYGAILDGQRVLLLQARAAAVAGDAARVRDLLDRDLTFWRGALASSDILITKMIAASALNHHFFFGNLSLRSLPVAQQAAAIPPAWRKPMSAEELSLLRVLAGEFHWMQDLLWRQTPEQLAELDDEMYMGEGASIAEEMLGQVARRFRPLQRRLNQVADVYVMAADSFAAAPLHDFEAVSEQVDEQTRAMGSSVMVSDYALRVATIEGVRRAALLTAELRSRGVSAGQVPAALTAAGGAQNPFKLQPFDWDPVQKAVIYTGPEENRWKRHTCFY